jgi:hypothetical protein
LAPPTDPKRARSILAYIRTASSMSIHMLINDYYGAASCGGYETFVTMSIGRNVAEVCCLLLRAAPEVVFGFNQRLLDVRWAAQISRGRKTTRTRPIFRAGSMGAAERMEAFGAST